MGPFFGSAFWHLELVRPHFNLGSTMTLRLSSTMPLSTTSIGSTKSCGNVVLDRLLQDTSISVTQKEACLTTLGVILKNLADPIKSQNLKYRTLKLDNPKLVQTLWSISYIQTEWFEQTLGFILTTSEENGSSGGSNSTNTNTPTMLLLPQPPSSTPLVLQSIYQPFQTSIETALELLGDATNDPTTATSNSNNKKNARQQDDEDDTQQNKLSEKQKARRLLEQSKLLEKQLAKEERARQIQLLQQDKQTRLHDPDWKPSLSAACAKSGTSISTFRDKYGEN